MIKGKKLATGRLNMLTKFLKRGQCTVKHMRIACSRNEYHEDSLLSEFLFLLRFLLSRLPKKAKKGGKSAILIKGMSTNKKTGTKGPNSGSPNIGIEKRQPANALSTTLPMEKGLQD